MGNVKSVNSLKRRMVIWRVLKIASYMLGFLLLFHLVYRDARSLSGPFLSSVAKLPVYFVLGAWAAVAVAQIICALICKNKLAKIIVVAIVGFAVIAGPLVYAEFVVAPEFETLAEEYEAEGLGFKSYGVQVIEYASLAEDLNSEVTDFTKLYNIKYESKVYGSVNTDTSDYLKIEEGTDEIDTEFFTTDYVFGLEKGDAAYSANGMYADGYVFGYAQARYILETYYNTQQKYIANGEDADAALNAAIMALTSNPYSDWNLYKQSDEYLAFYGSDLTDVMNAKRYFVTAERLDAILSVLGVNLGSGDSKLSLSSIISIVNAAMGGVIPSDVVNSINGNLSLDTILTIANGFGLDITEDQIMNLLEGFSNYQSPQTKPIFYFIQDAELRDYAYAKYFGEVHGGKVGSVLIGDRIGKVTMDTQGEPAEDLAARVVMFKRTEMDAEYMSQYYPWLVLRESYLYFAGLIPFSIACAYLFASLEKKNLNKLIKGGNR